MEHKIVTSRRQGELWKIKCSCGKFWVSERWHCEECFSDHASPVPQIQEEPHQIYYEPAYEPETTQEEWLAFAPQRDRFL